MIYVLKLHFLAVLTRKGGKCFELGLTFQPHYRAKTLY